MGRGWISVHYQKIVFFLVSLNISLIKTMIPNISIIYIMLYDLAAQKRVMLIRLPLRDAKIKKTSEVATRVSFYSPLGKASIAHEMRCHA